MSHEIIGSFVYIEHSQIDVFFVMGMFTRNADIFKINIF